MIWEDILNLPVGGWERPKAMDEHLHFVDDVNTISEQWDFALIRIWVRKETGTILWAFDRGCSCPAPFENTLVSDLRELPASPERIIELLDTADVSRPYAELRSDLLGVVRDAEEYIADAH